MHFVDVTGIEVPGGGAAVETRGDHVYIVLSLRNVGPGIGVLHGGRVFRFTRGDPVEPAPLESFRMLSRDLYIPPGKVGFWQIAWRGEQADERREVLQLIREGEFSAEILYGDFEGGQRVITRFRVLQEADGSWRVSAVRHWPIDGARPR